MKNKKTQRKICLIMSIFLITLVFSAPQGLFVASATNDDEEKEEKLEDTFDELEKIEKKIEKTQDIINLKQKEKEILNAQIANIASENNKIEKDIKKNEEEIEKLKQDIERIQKEIKQKEDHISLQKKILEKFIREKYQSYGSDNKYFTALSIGGHDRKNHGDRLSHATSSVGEFVEKIHKEQEELKKDKGALEKKSDRIKDAQYELEQRSDYLESSQNYKRLLAAEVSAEEDKYQDKLSDLYKKQLKIQQEISQLSASQIGTFSMKDLPDADEAGFDMPVKKPYVKTQGYGKTSFSSNYKGGLHNGVDYVAKGSQSILAVADGKVKATGNMGKYGYGRWVAIDHKNGLVTLYGHLSSVKVSKGDKVDQGDKLGKQGNTGFSTGPHLHFSVFAETTFAIVESSTVDGVYIPTGATVNPDFYL